ncbi:hypothetical protein Bca4012_064225 [Brassica carinata]|uniref:C2H2-type domain-containing protein n=1 Tax=Brassica carinata TaxID=52824 RepID=A0A8X7SF92_BRACI|nr:hypothetical protein Bca52824_033809 [Brassica carinata]
MAPFPFLSDQTKSQTRLSSDSKKKNRSKKTPPPPHQTQTLKQTQKLKPKTVSSSSSSSWSQIKNLLSCKQMEGPRVHDPSKITLSSCGSSLCTFSDVIYANARVIHRSDHSPESSNLGQDGGSLIRKPVTRGSSFSVKSNGCGAYTSYSSSKSMHFRKLSGCYECHMIVDPSRYPISPRIFACPLCGEVFPKLETLEIHQAVRHAVSELGPEDSGRNIVDIIFKSSWLRKDSPVYKIERILKVHNTQRTIQRFEDCRDAVKSHAHASTRREPRSAADGNELLRFHCTTVSCSLGSRGSTSLCTNVPGCRVCTIIRHGFHAKTLRLGGGSSEIKGVRTTASSGRAHDALRCFDQRRAMLVCRVIAGRVRRVQSDAPEDENDSCLYDSVTWAAGVYTNVDDLAVLNPKAILPCFVVIYKVSEP